MSVEGKTAILVDDILNTGKRLLKLLKSESGMLKTFMQGHGLLAGGAVEVLKLKKTWWQIQLQLKKVPTNVKYISVRFDR